MAIADTLPSVIGSLKNTRPLTAMGSLLRAPTMEYVAPDVTRTHQADVYEIAAAPRPVMAIAMKMFVRVSGGKLISILVADQSSKKNVATARSGRVSRLL